MEFRQHRRSSDGKRHASIPFFVKNPSGSIGRLSRQCTSEYKIEPIERFIRREILGLKHGQRSPKEIAVEQWMGITADEEKRAKPPGVWRKEKRSIGLNLMGEESFIERKRFHPTVWKQHTYPFLNLTLLPHETKRLHPEYFPRPCTRGDVLDWLAENYPGRTFPRSACLCCPFRRNDEWRWLRDNDPEGFADACRFDEEIRLRPEAGLTDARKRKIRKPLVGTIYTHRSLVPLAMVDLNEDADDPRICGMESPSCDGMCGL